MCVYRITTEAQETPILRKSIAFFFYIDPHKFSHVHINNCQIGGVKPCLSIYVESHFITEIQMICTFNTLTKSKLSSLFLSPSLRFVWMQSKIRVCPFCAHQKLKPSEWLDSGEEGTAPSLHRPTSLQPWSRLSLLNQTWARIKSEKQGPRPGRLATPRDKRRLLLNDRNSEMRQPEVMPAKVIRQLTSVHLWTEKSRHR